MLQRIADNAGPIGAHPVPVETQWTWGPIQVGHSTRYTEVLRKNGGRVFEISGWFLLSHCLHKKSSIIDVLGKAAADQGSLQSRPLTSLPEEAITRQHPLGKGVAELVATGDGAWL